MVQIKRCKELLLSTPLSLERIAQLTGFEHPEYMSVVFKRETGDTPGHYRARQGHEGHNENNGNHLPSKKKSPKNAEKRMTGGTP